MSFASRPNRTRPLAGKSLASVYDPTLREEAAPRAAAGPQNRAPPSPYDNVLLPSTVNWLAKLPADVAPKETAAWFPRIANRLARYWDSVAMMDGVFDELLVDRRGGRRGFPPKVAAELRALYVYFRTQNRLPAAGPAGQPQPAAAPPGAQQEPAEEPAGDSGLIAYRKPESLYDRQLNAVSMRWLNSLPRAVCPRETAAQFPRVVNNLARFWHSPERVAAIFSDLLLDRRSGRQGFPPEVRTELVALNSYFRTLYPG